MARPKTSVDRLANLRKTFNSNKGKVLAAKTVADAVGAAYWRACVKDLKAEGMNIESVRQGRTVVGYKYVDIKDAAVSTKRTEVKAEAAVAASKPKAAKKPSKPVKKVAAKKTASKAKPAAKKTKAAKPAVAKKVKTPKAPKVEELLDTTKVVEETPDEEADQDVLAILQQAGLK